MVLRYIEVVDHFVVRLNQSALISAEQAARVSAALQDGQSTAIRQIQRLGLLDQQVLAVEISQYFGLPQTRNWPRSRVLPDRISLRFMREHHVLPLDVSNDVLSVAVSVPTDQLAIEALRLASELDVELSTTLADSVMASIVQPSAAVWTS